MNNNNKILPLAALLLAVSAAQANVALKDKSDIVGKWTVYAESAKLDGEKKPLQVEWAFGADGLLQTTATDSVGRTREMKIAVKYAVEDGAIKKQVTPGRDKYETCEVVSKGAGDMVLKCAYLYYFLTRQ